MADIDVGQLSEAINDKMDRDAYNADNDAFANLTQAVNIDYVVEWQAPTAENNYTWYRLYNSGWVEQGGIKSGSGLSEYTVVTMPIEMLNTNYTIMATAKYKYAWCCEAIDDTKSSTQFSIYTVDSNNQGYARDFYWQVSGMSAQES